MKTVLTIAGSDTCGGAGIQADVKTITMNGGYAMTVLTALTAQNTVGVSEVLLVDSEFLKSQMEAVFQDIRPNAVKIGMIGSVENVNAIADSLQTYGASNVVLDTVMISTSGRRLLQSDALLAFVTRLMPLATVVTPNIPEAEVLAQMKIHGKEDMVLAAKKIAQKGRCAVLLKGGHSTSDADDLLYANGSCQWFEGKRIDNPNNHGTGCTLSSAIATNLAKGFDLPTAVKRAKEYVSEALAAMLDIGKGNGPLKHSFDLKSRFADEADSK